MKIVRNSLTISDIYQQMRRKELVVNKTYQRNASLWHMNAKSFFIDTILNGYPFPKITIRQIIDSNAKTVKREIVDGQQRLSTIRDFIDGKFKLTKVSKDFQGLQYNDLDEYVREEFLSYEVSVDNVVSGIDQEVLEIFRRMNSYSLPLNAQELRHSAYQGEFKWFIFHLIEDISTFLQKTEILSLSQITRMGDGDLLTEISQICIDGIDNRSRSKLDKLYKRFDDDLPQNYSEKINDMLSFIMDNFFEVCSHTKMTSYQFYSLCGALFNNKYGHIKNGVSSEHVSFEFSPNIEKAKQSLFVLLDFLSNVTSDAVSIDNPFYHFYKASTSTTHSLNHRKIRNDFFLRALNGEFFR